MRTVEAVLTLAADPRASAEVHAITYAKLKAIRQAPNPGSQIEDYVDHRIDQFLKDPAKFIPAAPVQAPPGMPIGDGED